MKPKVSSARAEMFPRSNSRRLCGSGILCTRRDLPTHEKSLATIILFPLHLQRCSPRHAVLSCQHVGFFANAEMLPSIAASAPRLHRILCTRRDVPSGMTGLGFSPLYPLHSQRYSHRCTDARSVPNAQGDDDFPWASLRVQRCPELGSNCHGSCYLIPEMSRVSTGRRKVVDDD